MRGRSRVNHLRGEAMRQTRSAKGENAGTQSSQSVCPVDLILYVIPV